MPLSNEFNVPPWNKRRWNLFKKLISQQSVIESAARYRSEYLDTGSSAKPMYAYFDAIGNYLPDGCDKAYDAFLKNPDITDQELADLIEPPVEIISHVNKHVGLKDNPSEAYKKYMHLAGADELPEDVDELFVGDTGLYLRIAPHTNRTEIKEFITKYYEKEMLPHLREQPIWDTKKSKYMDDPNSKTRRAIAENGPILQRILALRAEGKKYSEIVIVVDKEFGKYIEVQNMRKMVSNAKQS